MKKAMVFLLILTLALCGMTALAEAEDPAVGDWYASVEGVPVTLTLAPDGGYTLAMPAVLGEPQSGTWVLDDGFVRLDDGSVLNLVDESLLIWSDAELFFSREPAGLYVPAELLDDAILELYAGYWRCAFIDLGDAVVPADAVDESTDLYIENAAVALGGPRFGDIFWTFNFKGGALSADVNGQPTTIALQQDGLLRLTIGGEAPATLYLLPVLTEEAEDE